MKQQLSFAKRVTIEDIALFIGAYMHADDENLSVLNLGIGVLDIDFTHTNTLHLGPDKSDTALIGIFDEVFMPCLSIFTEELDSRLYRHIAMKLKSIRSADYPMIRSARARTPRMIAKITVSF